jgi:hypothetical protein
MSISQDFLRCRISSLQAIVLKYDEAFLVLASGIQEYILDTGQSKQTVRRQDIDRMQQVKLSLISELEDLCAQLEGNRSGTSIARPCW